MTHKNIIMIRYIWTVLVILGLTFQPFATAMSASMPGGDMDHSDVVVESSMVMEHTEESMTNHMMQADDSSIPCHETTAQDVSTQDCDECCAYNCPMMGDCVSSCAVSPFAAIQGPSTQAGSNLAFSSHLFTAVQIDGRPPTFIYHPPKHF